MQTTFNFVLIIIAIITIVVLLLQARGTGGNLFGEAETTFRSRRGIEQFLFRFSFILAILFVVVAILNVRFSG